MPKRSLLYTLRKIFLEHNLIAIFRHYIKVKYSTSMTQQGSKSMTQRLRTHLISRHRNKDVFHAEAILSR